MDIKKIEQEYFDKVFEVSFYDADDKYNRTQQLWEWIESKLLEKQASPSLPVNAVVRVPEQEQFDAPDRVSIAIDALREIYEILKGDLPITAEAKEISRIALEKCNRSG